MGVKGTARTQRWIRHGFGTLADKKPRTRLPSTYHLSLLCLHLYPLSISIGCDLECLGQPMIGGDGGVNLLDVAKEVDEVAGA